MTSTGMLPNTMAIRAESDEASLTATHLMERQQPSTLAEQVAESMWQKRYNELYESAQEKLNQQAAIQQTQIEEADRQAKDLTITSICAATRKTPAEVIPMLERQMERFRDLAEAVRVTTDLLVDVEPPDSSITTPAPRTSPESSRQAGRSGMALSGIAHRSAEDQTIQNALVMDDRHPASKGHDS
jgi:hypothetical protein